MWIVSSRKLQSCITLEQKCQLLLPMSCLLKKILPSVASVLFCQLIIIGSFTGLRNDCLHLYMFV